ncbi:MAG: hypothetical protein HKO58_04045, partial [Gammaproteobacteria bacterium]|nr:hypothetical protein [Gammaproteobacteria bacterium]
MYKTILIFLSVFSLSFSAQANDADTVVKSKELLNGNTVTVARQQHTNDAGTTHK